MTRFTATPFARTTALVALVLAAPACASYPADAEDPAEVQAEQDWIEARLAEGRPVYPTLADVPEVPADMRDARDWDAALAEILAIRDAVYADPNIAPVDERTPLPEFETDARERVRRDVEALMPRE